MEGAVESVCRLVNALRLNVTVSVRRRRQTLRGTNRQLTIHSPSRDSCTIVGNFCFIRRPPIESQIRPLYNQDKVLLFLSHTRIDMTFLFISLIISIPQTHVIFHPSRPFSLSLSFSPFSLILLFQPFIINFIAIFPYQVRQNF